MTEGFDMEIETMDEAVDYAIGLIGTEFEKTLQTANSINENPQDYSGSQAAMTAAKLAAWRYKIGIQAEYWKIKAAQTKRLDHRYVKSSLVVAYGALEEIINTLKLNARQDIQIATSR